MTSLLRFRMHAIHQGTLVFIYSVMAMAFMYLLSIVLRLSPHP